MSAATVPDAAPVVIHTERLVLREFAATDLDGVAELVGDDQVTVWLSFDSRTREEAAAMLDGILERQHTAPRSEYYLAIALAEDIENVIGFIRLGLGGHKAADVGYSLRPGWQGQGYAREATTAMIEFGFDELGLHRLTANIGPANESSMRLVNSLWFTYEGTIRDHVFTNGAWRDSRSYSLLAPEWADAPRCAHCSRRIPAPSSPGRIPKFCSTAHRQAAYRTNRSA